MLCKDRRRRWATSPRNKRPACIEPCDRARNSDGTLDHSAFILCPNFSCQTVHIDSGCTDHRDGQQCGSCPETPLAPNDPAFEQLIQQGLPGQLGNSLPKLDEMVWYVPEKRMLMPSLNEFTWDQPSKKRKHIDIAYEEEEQLSPKSEPARKSGEYEKMYPVDYPPPAKKSFLANMLEYCHVTPSHSGKSEPPAGGTSPTKKIPKDNASKLPPKEAKATLAVDAGKANASSNIARAPLKPVGAAESVSEVLFDATWDWSKMPEKKRRKTEMKRDCAIL
jgi:hypothetical protein